MDHPLWKWLWRIGLLVSLVSAIMGILDKSQHLDSRTLYALTSIALALGVLGLLLDFRPWRWLTFRRAGKYQEAGSLFEIAIAWKSSRPAVRHKLLCDRFPAWPAIADAAPAALGFTEWDEASWDELKNWLVAQGHAEERTQALFLPAAKVAAWLQKAPRRRSA